MTGFSRSAGTSPVPIARRLVVPDDADGAARTEAHPHELSRKRVGAALRRAIVEGAAQRQRQQHLDRRWRRAAGGLPDGVDLTHPGRRYSGTSAPSAETHLQPRR